MANYNFKLDLSKFEGFGKVTLTGKSGQAKRCIVIPIEGNSVFEGEKGTYIDLVCFETHNSDFGSHMVTLSKTKEEQEHEKQTGERVRKPIVGNLKEFGTQRTEVEEYTYQPQTGAQQARPAQQAPQNVEQDGADDLPFSQSPTDKSLGGGIII